MIKTKIVSSLEKALVEDNIDSFKRLERATALKGERFSFQLLHTYVYEGHGWDHNKSLASITVDGELAEYATMRDVGNVAVDRPTLQHSGDDDDYISKRPGIFPDILKPLQYTNKICSTNGVLFSVWVDIEIPEDFKAGESTLTFTIKNDGLGETDTDSIRLEVIDAVLPKESIYFTQWFHCDGLANYYNVPVWSERHWEIIENFARVAVKNGINLLLTPVFTPPLDTDVGHERLTTQLVGVTKIGNEYEFDFTLLDRWVEMCDRVGIKYFEISHLFTQWGSDHAPKIMATVDGEYKKIFGWETDALGEEYAGFLRKFITALLAHMKKNGNDKRCFFHISDEPSLEHLDNYNKGKAHIADLLEDYTIMDALSNYDFYAQGVVKTPIPANNHIKPFLENHVPGLWTYYCCSQQIKVSNRFIQMPSKRNRSIGFQMYKHDIVGFLHWGYNYYNNYLSYDSVNPYMQLDGNAWVSPGDAFSVYPSQNGEALESLRIIVFNEALQDMKAMRLCEKYYGKEKTVELIDEYIGADVDFDTCAKTADDLLSLREKINEMIKAAVSK